MEEQTIIKNPHAVELGRRGGLVRSEAKKLAAKRNILKRWEKNNRQKSQ